MGTSANIFVGTLGACYYAASGTALPTSLSNWDSVKTSFTDVGLIAEDGFTETPSIDTNETKDIEGNTCRVIKASDSYEVSFGMLETSDAVEDFVLGGHADPGTPLNITGALPTTKVVVLDLRDNVNMKRRLICIPRAKVKEQAERVYTSSDPVTWGVTIAAEFDGTKKASIFKGTYS
jgi:hypothetical protein